MGHLERNLGLVLSLVRRSCDALAAAVAPYAKREVEERGRHQNESRTNHVRLQEWDLLRYAALVSGSGCCGEKGARERPPLR